MIKRYFWPILMLAAIFSLLISVMQNIQSPIRTWLTFAVLLLCPGMAFIPLLNMQYLPAKIATGIALSIAINVTLSEIFVLAKAWHPLTILIIISLITLGGIIWQLWGNSPLLTRVGGKY